MSQLLVSASGQADFYLNVLSFQSPLFGEMNSSQNKALLQYYPIKAFQPELTANVLFPNEYQWELWQVWVRDNTVNSQMSNYTGNPGVLLNWPERNINNWMALITGAKAGGLRYNYTPYTQVNFQLITSLVSDLDIFFSMATGWQSLLGAAASTDSLISPPPNMVTVTPSKAAALGLSTAGTDPSTSPQANAASSPALIPGVSNAVSTTMSGV